MPTAYVQHPCSKEEKKKLNAEGFKILDLRLKPEKLGKGDKVVTRGDDKPKNENKGDKKG